MPSFKDKYGIAPPTSGALTKPERNHIRSKLGISNDPIRATYASTDERMLAFDEDQVAEARALYKALDKLGDSTAAIEGGTKGIHASTPRDRAKLYRELENLILPSEEIRPSEALPDRADEDDEMIVSVPIVWNNLKPTDEYQP